jgi:hypothetical protein
MLLLIATNRTSVITAYIGVYSLITGDSLYLPGQNMRCLGFYCLAVFWRASHSLAFVVALGFSRLLLALHCLSQYVFVTDR